jgi:hypothetical protein
MSFTVAYLFLIAIAYPMFPDQRPNPILALQTELTVVFSLQLTHNMQDKASYTHGNMLRPVSEDTRERSCCICYELFSPTPSSHGSEVPIQLPCGHVFGETCILRWTLTNGSCPLCRKDIFVIDGHPANHHLDALNSNPENPTETAHNDIWLDVCVWSNHIENQSQGSSVNVIDVETVTNFHTSDRSTVVRGYQPSTSSQRQCRANHSGLCLCSGEEDTSIAAFSVERLTLPSATAQSRHTSQESLDFLEIGSQFEDLEYRYKQWIDEYLNDPVCDEKFLFESAECFELLREY